MGLVKKLLSLALLGASLQGLALGQDFPQEDIVSGKALLQISETAKNNALARIEASNSSTCTKETVRVRKEWYVKRITLDFRYEGLMVTNRRRIPGEERTAYVKAVECLMNAPQVYPNVTGPK